MSRMHEKLDFFISCKFAFMIKIQFWDLSSIKYEKKITFYLHSFALRTGATPVGCLSFLNVIESFSDYPKEEAP